MTVVWVNMLRTPQLTATCALPANKSAKPASTAHTASSALTLSPCSKATASKLVPSAHSATTQQLPAARAVLTV
jgi:hypothetical protein